MHIECARKDKSKVMTFLDAFYNTSHKRQYPLGIKLRFICYLRDAAGLPMRQHYEHLHTRQKAFGDRLESHPVYALSEAYNFDTTARETISDGFMAMTHKKKKRQLFHSLE
jgi:hypothetical protein